jgi:16S rRNA (guanine527-N7)-methyltransferase
LTGGSAGAASPEPLESVLEEARELGFLGPGPIESHIAHSRGFASTQERAPESFLDLGSGGGVPGLVLALEWSEARGVLLDAMIRRTEFLRGACARLGVDERVTEVCDRAEVGARDPRLRGQFDVVTARSFGPPAVTAECGGGFVRLGGHLVVSEPPDHPEDRWPESGLVELGLEQIDAGTRRFAVLRRARPLGDRYPRRVGVPTKRPLWR